MAKASKVNSSNFHFSRFHSYVNYCAPRHSHIWFLGELLFRLRPLSQGLRNGDFFASTWKCALQIYQSLTCNSASDTSISPRYTNSMMNWRSAKATSGGMMMIGCLHGLSVRSFWKNVEHADNTTYEQASNNVRLYIMKMQVVLWQSLLYGISMNSAHMLTLHQQISLRWGVRETYPLNC